MREKQLITNVSKLRRQLAQSINYKVGPSIIEYLIEIQNNMDQLFSTK